MKYSIILPVRNGGNFVKECVDSILSQSLGDFDLIILENASTDNTLDWLFSLNDPRIKIYPSSQLLSIEDNWKRIVGVSKNEFITLIGHDDVLDKNYLETMNRLIERYPEASLYQAHFRYINAAGKEIKKCSPMAEKQMPQDVLHNFLFGKMDIMGTGFMMRSRDFDQVGGMPAYPNLLFADMELWIELSIKGCLVVAKEECFSYRVHAKATTASSLVEKSLEAFDQFVKYLIRLKQSNPVLATIIKHDSAHLLRQYCQGITHKVLRVPYNYRQTPSVSKIIDQFREYGKQLMENNSFEPLDSIKIRTGKLVDENKFLHYLFLAFKKLFPKPVF